MSTAATSFAKDRVTPGSATLRIDDVLQSRGTKKSIRFLREKSAAISAFQKQPRNNL
jgi:hypothetical protein